jgi:hypothetical protein
MEDFMTEDTTIKLRVLVMVPHYWGKADTLAEAWKNVCRESGKSKTELRRGQYRVYACADRGDAKTYVDGYGRMMCPEGIQPTVIERRD